jgi:coniferyl-aldehyde dehydrogenase
MPVTSLQSVFSAQQKAFSVDRNPDCKERVERLRRLRKVIVDNRDAIIGAVNRDFGSRSTEESRLAEIAATVENIDYAIKRVGRWMRPRSRGASQWFKPAKNFVAPQPLGVIGVMAPWNYPVNLSIAPLAAALAAGNRAMVKMSEVTPHTAALIKTIVSAAFNASEIAIIDGDAKVAAEFSELAFGHLLFTGSTAVGRMVMKAAAVNLTPLTLELGGKSPVIVDEAYSIDEAARRILWGKTYNAGQTCVAPDFVMVPEGRGKAFVDAIIGHYRRHFPAGAADVSYTSVVDQRQYDRLRSVLNQAKSDGATIVEAEPHTKAHSSARKFPLTLVLNPPLGSRVMTEELFGPILPVLEHAGVDQAIDMVNAGENPLALYYFGPAGAARDRVLKQTLSGTVAVNDVVVQFLQVDLPFGGVGASGFGRYHGKEGFETFSHLKPVFLQRGFGTFTGLKLLYPPYGNLARRLITMMGG